MAPFDPAKKKKKKKVVLQDSAEVVDKLAEKTENLTGIVLVEVVSLDYHFSLSAEYYGLCKLKCLSVAVADSGEPSFAGMKKKKKKQVSWEAVR